MPFPGQSESSSIISSSERETTFLVLRRTPYMDDNEIVAGLSMEQGQMSFFHRRPTSKRKNGFSQFDLFRLLLVAYRKGRKSDLCFCRETECLQDFSSIAASYPHFQAACWLGQFALLNIPEGLPHPRFFQGMVTGLQRLSEKRQPIPGILTGLGLTWLQEAGCLDTTAMTATEEAQCLLLLKMAAGGDMPALTLENWQQLWEWCYGQLLQSDCALPNTIPTQP